MRYGINVEVFMPDTAVVQQMVTKHGNNLFYNDVNLRLLCCQVRKVLPLRRALMNYSAWVTGLRRDQWATRSNIRKIEIDHDHGGIVKLAPLADWTEEEVWDYIRANDVPYNELYDKGYKSIGCAPCTRAVGEGAGPARGQMVVGDGRAERMRHALRDRDRRLRARAGVAARTERRRTPSRRTPMASDDQPKPGESITLDTLQRDILFRKSRPSSTRPNDPQAREVYLALKTAIESLEVPPDLQLRLGAIVEVALTSGRVRRLFGPGAELSLNALFLKTPRGREVAQSLSELNKALATLKGQTVEQITSDAAKPRRLRANAKDQRLPDSNSLRADMASE